MRSTRSGPRAEAAGRNRVRWLGAHPSPVVPMRAIPSRVPARGIRKRSLAKSRKPAERDHNREESVVTGREQHPTKTLEAERSNQALWDELAPVHYRSYREVEILRAGGEVLDEVETQELGPVTDRTLLHLQCHIGTDSLAWARRGARVTGVDFSARSIAMAETLARELQIPARFLHCNVYDLPQQLDERYDIVYTSRGVLCWLYDLQRWGGIIAHHLKPGGRFYLMESHPFCNLFDDSRPGRLQLIHSYFHDPRPVRWDSGDGDYDDASYVPCHPSYEWVWSIADVLGALLGAGLRLESVRELDRIFYRHFPGMVPCRDRWYQHPEHPGQLPLTFTLCARKPDPSAESVGGES
ncbi:MAG: methyltransferase domain-containing protein [Candidatus Eisenbacteria bacterium]|nr:methyltransferase domain-containing protein [Candidatus Eisenbacteria bacterium]